MAGNLSSFKGVIIYIIMTSLLIFIVGNSFQLAILILLSLAIPLYLSVSVFIYSLFKQIKSFVKNETKDRPSIEVNGFLMVILIVVGIVYGFLYSIVLSLFEAILFRDVVYLIPFLFISIGVFYYYIFKNKVIKINTYRDAFMNVLDFFYSE